jgi:hypothetical protein
MKLIFLKKLLNITSLELFTNPHNNHAAYLLHHRDRVRLQKMFGRRMIFEIIWIYGFGDARKIEFEWQY